MYEGHSINDWNFFKSIIIFFSEFFHIYKLCVVSDWFITKIIYFVAI